MSILLGYLDGDMCKRVHIHEYDPEIHKGKITCSRGHPVVGKRGAKVVWHYAHVSGESEECSREMGPWHRWWQDRVESDFLEIIIKREVAGGVLKKHIADMINGDDLVIEFQKSVVPTETIREREMFYDNMIWVFYCVEHKMKEVKRHGRYMHLKLLGGSKFFLCAQKRAFLDFDKRGVLEVMRILKATTTKPELYVRIWTMQEFDDAFMKGCLKADAPGRVDRQPYVGLELQDDVTFEDALEVFKPVKKSRSKKDASPGTMEERVEVEVSAPKKYIRKPKAKQAEDAAGLTMEEQEILRQADAIRSRSEIQPKAKSTAP